MAALLVLFVASPLWGQVSVEPMGPAPAPEQRWSSFLPLMAEEAKKRGVKLPLPFGVSVVSLGLLNRKIDVTSVRAGVNGAAVQPVSQYVDFGSTSGVFNANLKLDAWVLPFMNVYVLGGYVYNETVTRANISVPKPGPLPGTFNFTTSITTTLDGFVGGGGVTLAGGFGDFFLTADVNYSQTDIGFDDRFKALIATTRAGWNTRVAGRPLQLWLGGGFWDTRNTAKGHKDIPGVGRIQFEADQGPRYPWMMDVGGNLEITREFPLFVDVGFDFHGGYFAAVGPAYRF